MLSFGSDYIVTRWYFISYNIQVKLIRQSWCLKYILSNIILSFKKIIYGIVFNTIEYTLTMTLKDNNY